MKDLYPEITLKTLPKETTHRHKRANDLDPLSEKAYRWQISTKCSILLVVTEAQTKIAVR